MVHGQHLTEAICRNPKSHERAVLAEIDKGLLIDLVSIPRGKLWDILRLTLG